MDDNTTDTTNSTETTADQTAEQSTDQTSSTTDQTQADATSTEQKGDTLLNGGDGAEVAEKAATDGDEEGGAEETKPNPLLGAPDGDYEISGLPEGVTVDKAALDFLAPAAKEIGLSNEGMSRIAGIYAKDVLPHVQQQIMTQMQQDVVAQRAEWANAAKAEIAAGASDTASPYHGLDQAGALALSAKAIDRFGGAEFRTFLEETGLGNHPAMVAFAVKAGKAISEETTFERGTSSAPGKPATFADALYGGS